jgi:hypothetical protein
MPVLDSAIAYYLCGIMVVLALIIIIGASRQKAKELRGKKFPPSGQEGVSGPEKTE